MILTPPASSPIRRRMPGSGATLLAVALAATLAAASAAAIPEPTACAHDPSATVARAFRASKWVVRVRLVGVDDHWGGAGESWTLLHAQTLRPYKGRPPARLDVLTHGDDAGPWLDRGSLSGLGQDYLLFLRPSPPGSSRPDAAVVSEGCGASKPWVRVSPGEARALESPYGPVVLAERSPFRSGIGSHHPYGGVVRHSPSRPSHGGRWRTPLHGIFHPRPSTAPDV
jgi:hypothetical protein